ncbi:H(+)/Cl(-) exchange transporter ClcA [Deinococcus rubellus]|uniref:H(+)/Cl(-) exchange transporter ClcA n=1 Tax=Deinococcus rubellus TaxID=1889240 RepID=A0ABY5YI12_9DEIO|nr:H(+)/Cl(-) exchange transporter ClcA [Deinococcus rubellus]UWX64450.1 H(+)/Cl(-) exchange transporter ClcA [Deinococcus rubellus]
MGDLSGELGRAGSGAAQAQSRDQAQFVRRRGLYVGAILTGALVGLLVTAFRLLLGMLELRRATWTPALIVLAPMLGEVFSVWLVRRAEPSASGSGIPQLKAVLHLLRFFPWPRVLPIKFVGGLAAMGSGLPLGREGPSVQMGGSLGAAVAQLTHARPQRRLTLIAAGAGAGLAAAFNAPLAGVTFVLEELQRDFTPMVFTAALIACTVADTVTRSLAGQTPVFTLPFFAAPRLAALPLFLLLGLLCGLAGVVFNRSLLRSLDLVARVRSPLLLAALCGLGVGALGYFVPSVLGSGHAVVEAAAQGKVALLTAVFWLVLRLLVTLAGYAPGTPGGIFAPLLVMGALLGAAFGHLAAPLAGDTPAGLFAVVGMAALFSGVVRAPLTAVVLIVEMTGSYPLMLPLLAACFVAYAVAERLRDAPIYDALLSRELRLRSPDAVLLPEIMDVSLRLQPGAPFEGRPVRDLGLPPGCVIVEIEREGRSLLPHGDTELQAGDLLHVRLAPEAADAYGRLRAGTGHHSEH